MGYAFSYKSFSKVKSKPSQVFLGLKTSDFLSLNQLEQYHLLNMLVATISSLL